MLIPQELQLSRIMAFPYLVSFRGNLKIGLT